MFATPSLNFMSQIFAAGLGYKLFRSLTFWPAAYVKTCFGDEIPGIGRRERRKPHFFLIF